MAPRGWPRLLLALALVLAAPAAAHGYPPFASLAAVPGWTSSFFVGTRSAEVHDLRVHRADLRVLEAGPLR